LGILILADGYVGRLMDFMRYCFAFTAQPSGPLAQSMGELAPQLVMAAVSTAGPLVLITVFCGIAVTLLQTRFLVTTEPLRPKLSKINPLSGFKRLFSLRSVVETLKSLLKIGVLLILIFRSLRDMFAESSKYLYSGVHEACRHMYDAALHMILWIGLAFVVLAALDFFYQRWDYERQLKMSKEEVKEEFKQTEGNPQIKSKIREVQRSMARRRMMQKVPEADVVIRNPTHYAVALRYKPELDSAPLVLAKGQDELALRIVRVAEENQVAVIEDVPLARALYAGTELGQEIPQEFYGPVAEVLVYIFRLDGDSRIKRDRGPAGPAAVRQNRDVAQP